MSRWGKNIVVPLDSLCKEKENTNRPTVARSVGTVGKWGKMGFTSTRTYALAALPAAVAAAAAAAAAAASPAQSPASLLDDDMSPSVPEPPKPKKFFKSRNSAPPEVIAQIIQNLPRTPTSPSRDSMAMPGYLSTPVHGREPIKLKINKSNSAERKKKTPKKSLKTLKPPTVAATGEDADKSPVAQKSPAETKPKKKKEEKKLKPEAAPSRVIARARKTVNYCEEEDERAPTPLRDIVQPKSKPDDVVAPSVENKNAESIPPPAEPELPPPAAPCAPPPSATNMTASSVTVTVASAPKTPEHPPIVLRISKGTSRLVSTDSEELQPSNAAAASPSTQQSDTEPTKSRHASTEEVPPATPALLVASTPKIIVKPPKQHSPEPPPPPPPVQLNESEDDPPEINYCTVKISPDKPPKERLKLIIKTDVIRNAIAAAAAAAATKAAASAEKAALAAAAALAGGGEGEPQRPEKERKQKSKKHKHPKHAAVEQLATPAHTATAGSEFKTPSPHLALGTSGDHPQRTVVSPPALSERDFDSQSSVLGSISSKGNSTPQPLAQTVLEESCVIHSRGSSVITSDLETSQHSSLVAPPSDIESRLESMMMDGVDICPRTNATTNNLLAEEPLQEDILAVLRGEESETGEVAAATENVKVNGTAEKEVLEAAEKEDEEKTSKRRPTRGRGRAVTKTNYAEAEEDDVTLEPVTPQKTTAAASRTRGRKPAAATATLPAVEETATPTPTPAVKRATRRGVKKSEEVSMEVDVSPEKDSPNKSEEENTPTQLPTTVPATRRGRSTRNTANNNNLSNTNNNNNINKIAANLTAKAGAAVEEAKTSANTTSPTAAAGTTPRSYGRKRKNQQVTHVVQPSAEELEEQHQQDHPTPAKMPSIDLAHNAIDAAAETLANSTSVLSTTQNRQTPTTLLLDLHDDANSNSNSNSFAPRSTTPTSPPRRDYKIKDKFKRTLMLDNQVNCNAVVTGASASPTENAPHDEEPQQQQRGSVKLVITKKKGSIFKSRALVPSESEQSSAATKRHLYKHRWDAEANGGGTNSDGNKASSKAKSSEAQAQAAATRSAADDIFDDFSEDLSAGAHSRDNSPLLAKLTRFTKPNPQATGSSGGAANHPFDMDIDGEQSDTITGVRIDRKAKEYYTVVRNVKTAHQIQEIGEYQEMDDDVEYILDALQPHNPTPTRCLSALQLATKCMTPAFRMHVRAHGVVTKFFKALSDSNKDLSLGLCTSAIMYILSQEGLNMDLDRDSLELMMNLLEAEGVAAPSDRATYERNQQKVRELCEEIKAQGKATHLNVDSITVGTLAMETLLSLTSKRAGEWFKEELRELGGLEHIIKTISDCCRPIIESSTETASSSITWTQSLLDNMQTVERCMRVLENVTQMNEENQKYMLTYANGAAVNTLCTLYRLCDRELMLHPTTESVHGKDQPGIVMRELLMPVMKVLINLTHTFNPAQAIGAELLGKRSDVLDTSLHLLLQAPNYIPDRCVFELSILVLLLFINLTMHTTQNRMSIMKAYAAPADFADEDQQKKPTAVQAVMEYFYKCEELARLVEKNTDAILDNTDKNKKKQEEVDETVNNLLQKAGHHMEHTLKGSYAGILIGHLITDNEQFEATVRLHLRGNGFKEIVSVLEKYHTFMNLTASSEASVVAHIKSTKKLIDYFKKRDLVYEMNESKDCALPLNLETHHQHTTTMTPTDASATNAPTTTTRSSTQRVYKTYSQR